MQGGVDYTSAYLVPVALAGVAAHTKITQGFVIHHPMPATGMGCNPHSWIMTGHEPHPAHTHTVPPMFVRLTMCVVIERSVCTFAL